MAAKGVTCFVLKYRLIECKTDDPTTEIMTRGNLDEVAAPMIKLAMADGKAAVAYVRQNAKEYNINPNRIGIIGFSAGGTVTGFRRAQLYPRITSRLCCPDLFAIRVDSQIQRRRGEEASIVSLRIVCNS